MLAYEVGNHAYVVEAASDSSPLVNGDRGLLAMAHLQRETQIADQNLAEAETTRKIWERRVAALRNQSLDPDMLDERARVLLHYSRKDDIIVFTPTR